MLCSSPNVFCAFNVHWNSGSASFDMEGEPEDERETIEKNDKISQKTEIEEQNPNSGLPSTPLRFSRFSIWTNHCLKKMAFFLVKSLIISNNNWNHDARPLVQLPFSSKGKPPRSFLGVGSSSGLYTGQRYGKPNILRPQSKFEKQFQTIPDDDIPEVLRENNSPGSGIKTSSPNSKRVSPPQSNFGSSPSLRSGRKLILQSIPSFPSLTPQHWNEMFPIKARMKFFVLFIVFERHVSLVMLSDFSRWLYNNVLSCSPKS